MIVSQAGQPEADAAHWIKADGNRKTSSRRAEHPAGRTMGHAGAIVGGTDDSRKLRNKSWENVEYT
jgi:succinyl-CoA synthetase alpha subunit